MFLRDILANIIITAFTSFDNMVSKAVNVLSGNLDNLDQWATIEGWASAVLAPFCYTILGFCLMIELVRVLTKTDVLQWEVGLKVGVKLVLGKVMIDVAPTFLLACYLQSTEWVTTISSYYSTEISIGRLASTLVQTYLDESNILALVGLFASIIIPVLAVQICGLLVQVIAYGRMFELYVYLLVSPLPCAFFPLGDGSGGGFSRTTAKFLKAFVAVCLQGVMMLLCIILFNLIIEGTMESLINAIFNNDSMENSVKLSELAYTLVMGSLVLVMSVSKCGSWAKSILDAN